MLVLALGDFAISRSTAHLIDQLFKEEAPSNDAEVVGGQQEPLVGGGADDSEDEDDNIWNMPHMLH